MRALFLVAVLAALSGCATMGMTPQEIAAADQSQCESYGFQRGTEAFASCMMQIDYARQADNQRRWDNVRAGLRSMNAQLNPPSVTCNTSASVFGNYGSSTTTCR